MGFYTFSLAKVELFYNTFAGENQKMHTILNSIHKNIALATLALLLLIIGCANPGTPSGGPRDRKPPVLIKSVPQPNSTGFSGNMLTLTFDENIQLKDQDTKFVMSPPLAIQPKLDAHANVLRVRFDSDTILMPGTTYTLDFADCLSDLNEGNIYQDFTFTFSTGESQDSMMISGNLYDAQTISPISGVYVLLQQNLADSAFRTVPPVRIAKTDNFGRFQIKNVPAGRDYRIFALDDQNRNFLFDQPGEQIAWFDGNISPAWEIRQITDSVRIDSLSLSADTADWVFEPIVRDTLVYTPDSLTLFAFTEDYYNQYITSDERNKRNVIKITFNKPMKNKPQITFPGQDNSISHALTEYSANNDSVTIWLTDSLIYKGDSVIIATTYNVLDSMKQLTLKTDTLDLWFLEKATANNKNNDKSNRRRRKKETEKKPEVPTLKLNINNSIAVFSTLSISSETPFAQFDWNAVRISHKVDTIYEPIKFTTIPDTINLRHKAIKADWIAGDSYKIEIDSAAVRDIYDLQCNKIESKFSVASLDKYGTLYIVVTNIPNNALLQLVPTTCDKVLRQNKVPANGKVAFRYLKPSEYMIRIVSDDNNNGQWDIGNYEQQLQPEKITYYMGKVNVRANWDIKVDFDANAYSPDKFSRKFRTKSSGKNKNR